MSEYDVGWAFALLFWLLWKRDSDASAKRAEEMIARWGKSNEEIFAAWRRQVDQTYRRKADNPNGGK